MTAEQFSDALTSLTGDWPKLPSSVKFDFGADDLEGGLALPKWIWTDPALATATERLKLAQDQMKLAATVKAGGDPGAVKVRPAEDRHHIVFRRHFSLGQPPTGAFAMVSASHAFDFSVNGTIAKAALNDGFRLGRVKIYDIAPLLKTGDNVIAPCVAPMCPRTHGVCLDRRLCPGLSLCRLAAEEGGEPGQTHLNSFLCRFTLPENQGSAKHACEHAAYRENRFSL